MAYGEQFFTFDFASAASKSTQVAEVRGYQFASIQVPAFATLLNSNVAGVKLEGGYTDSTGQLAPVKAMGVYSGGSGILEWETPDSSGNFATGDVPIWGLTHIRLALTQPATDAIGSFVVRAYNQQ